MAMVFAKIVAIMPSKVHGSSVDHDFGIEWIEFRSHQWFCEKSNTRYNPRVCKFRALLLKIVGFMIKKIIFHVGLRFTHFFKGRAQDLHTIGL